MHFHRFFWLAITALAGCSVPAFADFVALSCTASGGPTLITSTSISGSEVLTCPEFNSSLGKLTGVTLQEIGVTGPLAILGGSTITVSANGKAITANTPFVGITATIGPFPGGDLPLISTPLFSTLGVADGQTQTLSVPAVAIDTVSHGHDISVNDLAFYVGNGTFSEPISITSFRVGNLDPSVIIDGYSATVQVQGLQIFYFYTPAPEPSTFTLAGCVLGIGWALNRILGRRRY